MSSAYYLITLAGIRQYQNLKNLLFRDKLPLDLEMHDQLAQILVSYRPQRGVLVPILQKVQGVFGYLPPEAVSEIAQYLRLSASEVYGVASFYAQFRFERQGEHIIKVCEGTACHVGGSPRILEEVERGLDIDSGGTTNDYKFSLERVACVGCCALAPVMIVDDTVYSKMTTTKAKQVLDEY